MKIIKLKFAFLLNALILITFLSIPSFGQGTIVFKNDFEGPDQAVTDARGTAAAATMRVLDPGPFDSSGNHVLQITKKSGSLGSVALKKNIGAYDRLYARWYMKFPQGYNFAAGARHGSWYGGGTGIGIAGFIPEGNERICYSVEPNTDGRLTLYAYYHGMTCSNPPAGNGTCWGKIFTDAARPPLVVNQWSCIEVMIDAGTPTPTQSGANGQFNLWVDGIQYGPWTGMWLRTVPELKINSLRLELYVEPALPYDVTALYDKVVLSTERIGTIPNGIGDTTLPAAPASLKATAISSSQINLSWTDNSSTETGFLVEKKVSPTASFTPFSTTAPNNTSASSTGLGSSHMFYFRVRAINNNGRSAYSNVDSASTLPSGSILNLKAGNEINGNANGWVFTLWNHSNRVRMEKGFSKLEVFNVKGQKIWEYRRISTQAGNVTVSLPENLEGILFLNKR